MLQFSEYYKRTVIALKQVFLLVIKAEMKRMVAILLSVSTRLTTISE